MSDKIGKLVTEVIVPPYDRWLLRERCPRCGSIPVIVNYSEGEWGIDVVLKCPRCGLMWGVNET